MTNSVTWHFFPLTCCSVAVKNRRAQEYADLVFKQLLDFDLSLIGVKSIPACLFNTPKGTFNGKFFLQVN